MQDQQLSEHFRLSEFIKPTDSKPDDIEIGHLRLLCTYLLEPLRQAWGSGMTVTSGWRSWTRNAKIGGSKTSAHTLGYAADIVPSNGKMAEFKAFVKRKLSDSLYCYFACHTQEVPFDQCIDERNAAGSEWVHIGLMNAQGEQRRQFLITTDGKNYKTDKV